MTFNLAGLVTRCLWQQESPGNNSYLFLIQEDIGKNKSGQPMTKTWPVFTKTKLTLSARYHIIGNISEGPDKGLFRPNGKQVYKTNFNAYTVTEYSQSEYKAAEPQPQEPGVIDDFPSEPPIFSDNNDIPF